MKHLPNILTLFRIMIIPILVVSFYIPGFISSLIVALLFLVASITDFFDGYFARMLKVKSNFGACLDPIADKLLVVVALTMLVHFGDKNLAITIPSLIIICREILVSGLREFLSSINVSMPVSTISKYKTAIQMIAITLLLFGKQGSIYTFDLISEEDILVQGNNIKYIIANIISTIGEILLFVAAILTIITGYMYTKIGIKNM